MTVLLAETERELQDFLHRAVKEGQKKGLMINCKKTKSIVISKRKNPSVSLRIEDVKIEMVQKFKYQGIVLSEESKNASPKSIYEFD